MKCEIVIPIITELSVFNLIFIEKSAKRTGQKNMLQQTYNDFRHRAVSFIPLSLKHHKLNSYSEIRLK